MIDINISTTRYRLTVKGHAQPEESGQYKEICAASGALAQSLMYSLTKLPKGAMKSVEYKPEKGDLLIRIFPEDRAADSIKDRFVVYADGMELLAKSHPYSVSMIRDGKKILPEKEEQGA